MTIKLYTQVALTVALPQYGLKNGDVAYAIEHFRSLTAQELDEIQHRSLSA